MEKAYQKRIEDLKYGAYMCVHAMIYLPCHRKRIDDLNRQRQTGANSGV